MALVAGEHTSALDGKESKAIRYLLDKEIQEINVGEEKINLKEYLKNRGAMDLIWNLGEDILEKDYKRLSKFPDEWIYSESTSNGSRFHSCGIAATKSANFGHASISSEAKKTYKETLKKWDKFKEKWDQYFETQGQVSEILTKISMLATQIMQETKEMSSGKFNERAKQIVSGEISAVGQDINKHDIPETIWHFRGFLEIMQKLLNTPHLTFCIDHRGEPAFSIMPRGYKGEI